MRLKKWISAVLTASMVAALAGCSSQTQPADAGTTETDSITETTQEKASEPETQESSEEKEETGLTYADTISWDATYDVVVVGFGGAGAVASTVANDEGASVLLLEKAPKGHEGGNTRYSSQRFLYTEDVEGMKTYLKAVRGLYTNMSDEIVDYLAEGFSTTLDWYKSIGAPVANPKVEPEYPDLECADSVQKVYTVSSDNESRFWNVLHKNVVETHKAGVEVWYESPATKLIQDPFSKTVIGVEVAREEKILKIRANNGVILATGGFENNQEMIQDYLQKPYAAPLGSTYNTGDGITMALGVGANLWHMSALSGPFLEFINPESGSGYRQLMGSTGSIRNSSAIIVGADGTRFIDETLQPKHGHVPFHGMYIDMPISFPLFLIFDQKQIETAPMYKIWSQDSSEELEKGWITKGETLEELAEKIGLPAEGLAKGVAEYNAACSSGQDPLGRPAEFLHAIGEGPYYGVELTPAFINTQGGPERNTECEVLDSQGNPIPHLYSAGELGSFYGSLYQGAGNLAECILTGQTAGKNAASPKEPLPVLEFTKAEQPNPYKAEETEVNVELGENEYEGSAIGIAPLSLKVTVENGTITAINMISETETKALGDIAIDKMIERILQAQSTDVDTVSGATLTSNAVIVAVEEALEKAGISLKATQAQEVELGENEYLASATGMDEIVLKVKIENGKIIAIDVVSENETNGLGDKAIPVVIASILEAQSTDIDGVSGATMSSDAVKEAVNKALEQAK